MRTQRLSRARTEIGPPIDLDTNPRRAHALHMKLIGITPSVIDGKLSLNRSYVNAFTRPGITPVILPQFDMVNRETTTIEEYAATHKDHIDALVEALGGLCLSGGADLNPTTFEDLNWGAIRCNSERDFMEIALFDAFVAAGKPVLGICRGFQAIAQRLGLSHFMQDLKATNELHDGGGDHEFKDPQEPVHLVYVRGAYQQYLSRKTGREITTVNVTSRHHQGLVLDPSCKLPKNVKTNEQYNAWMANALLTYEQENEVDIIACTGMVIEGYEKADAKIVAHQAHPEGHGPNSLAIGYWVDTYVLDAAPAALQEHRA